MAETTKPDHTLRLHSEGSNSGLIDQTLLESLSLSSDSDIRNSTEVDSHETKNAYSADIKPLEFTIKRNNDRRSRGHRHSNKEIIGKDTTKDTRSKVQARIHGNTISQPAKKNIFEEIGLFNNIDLDQFEQYLKEPSYIKTVRKTKGVRQLRRLFLAQELQVPQDKDIICPTNTTPDSNNPDGLHRVTSNQISINSSTVHTRSTSTSPNFSPRPSVERTISNSATPRAIWATKFSHDGKFLATGGKDCNIAIWKVLSSPIERLEMDTRVGSNNEMIAKKLRLQQLPNMSPRLDHALEGHSVVTSNLYAPVFNPLPYRLLKEHTHDVLALDWSKNNFLLSSSMDNTVKLWHPDKPNSLKTFHHPDFVTSIAFHPTDDRFFVSGCLDHKCRLWSILDSQVSYEFDAKDLITFVTFSPNDAKYTIVGTFNGFVYVLMTRGLEPLLSFHVTDSSTQRIDSKFVYPNDYKKKYHGPRVTGIDTFIDEYDKSLRAVITCNDSRIRIFNLKTKQLIETLKGFHSGKSTHTAHINSCNTKSPIVLSSSDDNKIYGWNIKSYRNVGKENENDNQTQGLKRKSLSRSGSFKSIFNSLSRSSSQKSLSDNKSRPSYQVSQSDDIIATSSNNSSSSNRQHTLKLTSLLPSSSSSSNIGTPMRNSHFVAFNAHQYPVTTVTMAPASTSKTLSLSNDFICELSLEFFYKGENRDDISSSMKMTDNTENPSNIFNSVTAIGSIIVSTDNNGNIRIFRADISSKLRSIILKSVEDYKLENGYLSDSSTSSLTSLNRTNSLHSTLSNIIRPHSYNNLANLHEVAMNHNAYQSASRQTRNPKRSSSFNNIHNSLSALTATSNAPSRGSRAFVNGSASSLAHSMNSEHSASRSALTGLQCDVCKGTTFETISSGDSKTAISQLEGGNLFCKDCGTILNSFR